MLPIDHLYRAAEAGPDRIAVKDGDTTITYADLVRRADALAAGLQAIDPTPQSRVGISAYNTVEHLLAWLATFAAGKTWVPLNPRNGNDELSRIVGVTEPSIIVADHDCLGRFDTDEARMVVGRDGAGAGDLPRLDDLIAKNDGKRPERPEVSLDDLQAIKFTGGSSGVPKGCMQTYRVWNTCIASMLLAFEFDGDDRHLLAAPMTHGANTLIMPTFAVGGMQVFMEPKATPKGILDAFERDRITSLFVPPTVIYMMMETPELDGRDFSSLKHMIVGGAAIRPEQLKAAMPVFNNALETCYGQTEAPQIAICMRAEDWRDKANFASTGRATPLTGVGIKAPDGRLLDAGEEGEIVLKGDLVMKGYFRQPEKTAETIIDGWLHTGDVGLIDERGFIFVKDRIRDVIITGGFNVYPSDVEAVLGTHPDVAECIVFAVPDDKWGEVVTAAVELRDGAAPDPADIIAYVRERMDGVKTPKAVHIVDELPRSPVGKVLRREARTQFSGGNAA